MIQNLEHFGEQSCFGDTLLLCESIEGISRGYELSVVALIMCSMLLFAFSLPFAMVDNHSSILMILLLLGLNVFLLVMCSWVGMSKYNVKEQVNDDHYKS